MLAAIQHMPNETQPIPYTEITDGSKDNHVSYGELTPEALLQLKTMLGKTINVTSAVESWIYTGPEDEEDHDEITTRVYGTVTNVDEKTIEVKVIYGEITYNNGPAVQIDEPFKQFPFYEHRFSLKRSAQTSQISSIAIDGQTYQMRVNERRERDNENIVNAMQEISTLISSYNSLYTRPDITRITAILQHVSTGEFPILYKRLAELADSPLAEIRFDSTAEIMRAAESDRQFGALTDGMADYYDNEVRASRGLEEDSVLDSVIELVQLVEKNRMETVNKPTKTYIVLYDNGDEIQASHGKTINVPEGSDPQEFARRYLLTITSPGKKGLLVEEVYELKPGETFTDF